MRNLSEKQIKSLIEAFELQIKNSLEIIKEGGYESICKNEVISTKDFCIKKCKEIIEHAEKNIVFLKDKLEMAEFRLNENNSYRFG